MARIDAGNEGLSAWSIGVRAFCLYMINLSMRRDH
jgi:hypothetical protein